MKLKTVRHALNSPITTDLKNFINKTYVDLTFAINVTYLQILNSRFIITLFL